AVLLAGGAWSAAIADQLGLLVPVYPQRGQILHLELPETDTTRWPIVVGFHSHYLLTFPTSRVVAGATPEDTAGFHHRMTAGGVRGASPWGWRGPARLPGSAIFALGGAPPVPTACRSWAAPRAWRTSTWRLVMAPLGYSLAPIPAPPSPASLSAPRPTSTS